MNAQPRWGADPAAWKHFARLTPLLLPVVSNPHSTISSTSSLAAQNKGKVPSEYDGLRQIIGITGWQKLRANSIQMKRYMLLEPDYGICIVTQLVRGIDVDITDAEVSAVIRALIEKYFGALPIRCRSNSLKFLAAITLPGAYTKRAVVIGDGKVEFLATGQQFIAAGTHNSGVPYEWENGLPVTFPVVTPEAFEAFWSELISLYGAEEPARQENAERSGDGPSPSGCTPENIDWYLSRIDPSKLKYDDWLHVLMAVHFESQASQRAFRQCDAWSERDATGYRAEHWPSKWESFHLDHLHPHNIHTLIKLAGGEDYSSEYESQPPLPHRLAFLPDVSFLSRPPLKWWVKRLLPACEIGMGYGATGSAKSFFYYDLFAKIAQGEDWRGRKTRKARIARIVAEGSAGDTNRVRAYASINGGALPGFIECHARLDLNSEDYTEIGKQIQLAGGADIVVVDTLTAAAPSADQNSQLDMGRVIDHCRSIRAATGATIFWIHHSGKDTSKGSRGSSVIPQAVDVEIELTVLPNGARQAEVTKLRDGEKGEIFPFVLRQVVLGTDEDGEPITSCVVDHLPAETDRPRRVTSRQPQGANQKIVWKSFQDLCGITGETTVAELCAVAAKSMTTTEGKRDTRPQRVRCAIEALGADDFLILDGEAVRCI